MLTILCKNSVSLEHSGNHGVQFQYPPFNSDNGAWPGGNENVTILSGYSIYDNYAVDGTKSLFIPIFVFLNFFLFILFIEMLIYIRIRNHNKYTLTWGIPLDI